jgi:hypothetical protein
MCPDADEMESAASLPEDSSTVSDVDSLVDSLVESISSAPDDDQAAGDDYEDEGTGSSDEQPYDDRAEEEEEYVSSEPSSFEDSDDEVYGQRRKRGASARKTPKGKARGRNRVCSDDELDGEEAEYFQSRPKRSKAKARKRSSASTAMAGVVSDEEEDEFEDDDDDDGAKDGWRRRSSKAERKSFDGTIPLVPVYSSIPSSLTLPLTLARGLGVREPLGLAGRDVPGQVAGAEPPRGQLGDGRPDRAGGRRAQAGKLYRKAGLPDGRRH